MTGGVWKEDGAGQILNITSGQGRLKLADSGTSPRAKRWARASRAPRVQEAWAGYPLRPATPLWTMAAATAPGTRRLGLEQRLSVALSKGGLGQACATSARQDRCTWPAGSCASCNHWERVGNASVGLSSCQRAASEEAPQALD